VWTKDTKGRFVYSNKAFKVLLNIEDSEILGKTEQDMIDALQKKGIILSISDNCKKADELVLKTKKISIYIEKGYINNKFVALNILKAPIYKYHRGKQKIIGTISLGRDITLDWQEHENIFRLWNSGDKEGAFELFKLHKSRFETLTDRYKIHSSYINLAKEDK
jgi:PAS domain-containing protein